MKLQKDCWHRNQTQVLWLGIVATITIFLVSLLNLMVLSDMSESNMTKVGYLYNIVNLNATLKIKTLV